MEYVWIILGGILSLCQLSAFIIGLVTKAKQRKIVCWAIQLIGTAVNVSLAVYYNHLPGRGFMPGLTYFFEFMICAAYAGIGILLLLVFAIVTIVRWKQQ